MPSASSVSAVCLMVGQSDGLPMMIATGFPVIDPSKTPAKEAGDYRGGRRGGKAAAQPCGNRAAPPISAAKISQLGCMAPVRERGGVSLSFANDVSERSLDFAALQYGVGGLPVMRRANAHLATIPRPALAAPL